MNSHPPATRTHKRIQTQTWRRELSQSKRKGNQQKNSITKETSFGKRLSSHPPPLLRESCARTRRSRSSCALHRSADSVNQPSVAGQLQDAFEEQKSPSSIVHSPAVARCTRSKSSLATHSRDLANNRCNRTGNVPSRPASALNLERDVAPTRGTLPWLVAESGAKSTRRPRPTSLAPCRTALHLGSLDRPSTRRRHRNRWLQPRRRLARAPPARCHELDVSTTNQRATSGGVRQNRTEIQLKREATR